MWQGKQAGKPRKPGKKWLQEKFESTSILEKEIQYWNELLPEEQENNLFSLYTTERTRAGLNKSFPKIFQCCNHPWSLVPKLFSSLKLFPVISWICLVKGFFLFQVVYKTVEMKDRTWILVNLVVYVKKKQINEWIKKKS